MHIRRPGRPSAGPVLGRLAGLASGLSRPGAARASEPPRCDCCGCGAERVPSVRAGDSPAGDCDRCVEDGPAAGGERDRSAVGGLRDNGDDGPVADGRDAARRVVRLQVVHQEAGITTAEYAVGTAAGAGLAGLLYTMLTGGFGDQLLTTLFDHVLGLLGIG